MLRLNQMKNLVAKTAMAKPCTAWNTIQSTIMTQARSMAVLRATRKQPTSEELAQATLMCEYASHGNIEGLAAAKSKGVSLDVADYDFRTPLHLAAAVGNLEAVQWLVANGAKMQVDRFGGLAVHDALRNNHGAVAEFLQDHQIASDVKFASSKAEQMDQVFKLIVKEEGLFSFSLIANEVDYFYNNLGLNWAYFEYFTPTQIAKHIHCLIAAKKVAEIGALGEDIKLSMLKKDSALYLCTSPSQEDVRAEVEQHINSTSTDEAINLTFIKSSGTVLPGGSEKLQLIQVQKAAYENPSALNSDDVHTVATSDFIKNKSKNVINNHAKVIRDCMRSPHPQFSRGAAGQDGESTSRLIFALRTGRAAGANHSSSMFQVIDLCEKEGVEVNKAYMHTFANGVTAYSVYSNRPVDDATWAEVRKSANLIFTLPEDTFLDDMLKRGDLTAQETFYLYSASQFAYYFMYQWNEDFENLYTYLDGDVSQQSKLVNLKMGLDRVNIKMDNIKQTILRHTDLAKALYKDFESRITGNGATGVAAKLDVPDPTDAQLLKTYEMFNRSMLKTNFFKEDIGAIGYRLDPAVFLGQQKLPEIPFGIFHLVGRDFNGFHVRFRDISRGGIRMILSTKDNYERNRMTQFQENYGLAYTQKLKNKDITESGSKGTVLLRQGRGGMSKNHQGEYAFMQYIDTLLDLMLETEGVSSIYTEPEYLFFGPDENTAPLMDPAAYYTQKKGYGPWRSITTGKSGTLGGIPHDTYGMTTRSVRQFVQGVQRKLGHKQSEKTKFVTGGPDGDLGSNEVILGEETIVGIVDGSGVIYDPEGLDRDALLQLCDQRVMVNNYKGKFSDGGFFIGVDETNRTLPDGQVIDSGMKFRNNFHLNKMVTADYFVPCGGRPESVNLENVDQMFTEDGKLRFDHIIEGANLFITEPARIVLQDAGCILFKDASTNKGGVTSSSLEVLAALSFDDEGFAKHMAADEDGRFPEFYQEYVKEIIERVETNAYNEFEFIWEEHVKTGKRTTDLTLELSEAMNDLFDVVLASKLFDNENVKRNVLKEYFPKTLLEQVGYDALVERIPPTFLKAAFSKYLAAQYFYVKGTKSNVYEFYEFVSNYDHE